MKKNIPSIAPMMPYRLLKNFPPEKKTKAHKMRMRTNGKEEKKYFHLLLSFAQINIYFIEIGKHFLWMRSMAE